ncbi:MAG: sterol desaturase family protein [Myxococcales bacterium]|nr:sterol desaturase family protein [Myxococcales bacterium]
MLTLLQPFLDPGSRTYFAALLVSGALALLLTRPGWTGLRAAAAAFLTPSSRLDVQLLLARQLVRLAFLGPTVGGAWWVANRVVGALDMLGRPALPTLPLAGLAYTIVLFVLWDASRFASHWLMHRVPALWTFHQVHHSATNLTPLTFHRVHPVESVVYALRGALVTGVAAGVWFWVFGTSPEVLTVLGVHAVGWTANLVTGNLRHSHVWLSFGPVERWLLSPAQHQLHHALDHDHVNLGTWLACWDRMAGTLELAGSQPTTYGLRHANHTHDLLSAWMDPVLATIGWNPRAGAVSVGSGGAGVVDDDGNGDGGRC